MEDSMKDLIKKLVETPGPSGYEHQVRDAIRTEIESYVDDMWVDALGNLIARKGSVGTNGKTVMMAAHMDEIGIIVTHIDERGFAYFTSVGYVFPYTCVGSRVRFVNGAIGVIGIQLGSFAENIQNLTLEKMFVDVGATGRADCPVKVGDVASFHRPFEVLGNHLVSKAMDDRIACAVLIKALQEVKETPHQLNFVFTVQEEVGLRGATTSAFGVNPDYGIAIDVTPVLDTPRGKMNELVLGKGPALKVMDSSLIVDPRVLRWTVKAAEKLDIPFQYEVLDMGGTDAGAINLTHAGVPATTLSVPTRYVHTPSEMVDLTDVQNTVRLLVELISHPITLEE
jgi:tetrahedral aminopeptidase